MTVEHLQRDYPGIVTILDAKRGDIGSTNEGYVSSIFDWFGFDAVTLHPYLGKEALAPFLERKEKGSIILCRTSNPGAGEFQDLVTESGTPFWQVVAERIRDDWNTNGNCLLVVGATYPKELRMIRSLAPDMIFLVPGVGTQGGDVREVVESGINADGMGIMINSSRNIIFSKDIAGAAKALRDEINLYR